MNRIIVYLGWKSRERIIEQILVNINIQFNTHVLNPEPDLLPDVKASDLLRFPEILKMFII